MELEFLMIFGVLELFSQFAQNWRVMELFWLRIHVKRAKIHRDTILSSQIQITFLCAYVGAKNDLNYMDNSNYFLTAFFIDLLVKKPNISEIKKFVYHLHYVL